MTSIMSRCSLTVHTETFCGKPQIGIGSAMV
ncbi:hypothetical protein M3J09_009040 [Ascochyta lentis]